MPRADQTPPDDVLAAVAAAYRVLIARAAATPRPAVPRWRLAARLDLRDVSQVRDVARATSRWNAAGRLDG